MRGGWILRRRLGRGFIREWSDLHFAKGLMGRGLYDGVYVVLSMAMAMAGLFLLLDMV
jgi:hypothetical protein